MPDSFAIALRSQASAIARFSSRWRSAGAGVDAGSLNVGGVLGMSIGGNWDLGVHQTGETKVVARANGISDTNINTATGSSVNVGGVAQIGVGGNLTATGANLSLAGGGTIAANGDVTLQAATTTSTVDSNSSGSDSHGSYSESEHLSDQTLTATTLNAGSSLTVASGNDINVTGSTINLDTGTATLAPAGNVNIGAATQTQVDDSQETHSHSNVVSGKEVSSSGDTTTTLSQGSTISADAVSITSGKDINVAGSTIVGTGDVALAAAHDVNITTSQNSMQSSSSYQFSVRTGGGQRAVGVGSTHDPCFIYGSLLQLVMSRVICERLTRLSIRTMSACWSSSDNESICSYAQRASVQGQPCVDCGALTDNQVADHIDPLVVQYYRDGAVDVPTQSSVDAVQPHCPTCSAIQGGQLGAFGKAMKKLLRILMMSSDIANMQKEVCLRFGAPFEGCDLRLNVGISRNVKDGARPLNVLRTEPEGDTCGWYIWAGEKFSEEPDFFVPLHASHLQEWAPLVLPYLGLPPGWRFLITEQYEDVWEDPQLL